MQKLTLGRLRNQWQQAHQQGQGEAVDQAQRREPRRTQIQPRSADVRRMELAAGLVHGLADPWAYPRTEG